MVDKVTLTNLANLQNETTAVSAINNNNAALTTAVNNTLSRDGTSPNQMNSDFDMNGHHIINLPTPINNSEPLRLQDSLLIAGGGVISSNPLPVGGTANQVLTKNSSTNYDTSWVTQNQTLPAGSVTGTQIANNTIANANLTNMPAISLKGNPTNSTASPQDFTITGLSALSSPDPVADFLLISENNSGTLRKVNTSSMIASTVAGVAFVNGQAGSILSYYAPQGRLTLATNTPVMATSVAGATTIFYTPYVGNLIPIYDGTNLVPRLFTELSASTTDTTKSPAVIGTSKINDWFVWSDAGTLRLSHGPDWTSDTARSAGTALTRVNGIWLNNVSITNGPAASRGTYVGTTRSNASNTLDYKLGSLATGGAQAAFLNVWNTYNRVAVNTSVSDSFGVGVHAPGIFNIFDGLVHNFHDDNGTRINFVSGLAEETIGISLYHQVGSPDAPGYQIVAVGITMDQSGPSALSLFDKVTINYVNSAAVAAGFGWVGSISLNHCYNPQLGFHFIQDLENQDGQSVPWTGQYYGNDRMSFDGYFRM